MFFCLEVAKFAGSGGVLVLSGGLVESCGSDFVVQELWSQFDAAI